MVVQKHGRALVFLATVLVVLGCPFAGRTENAPLHAIERDPLIHASIPHLSRTTTGRLLFTATDEGGECAKPTVTIQVASKVTQTSAQLNGLEPERLSQDRQPDQHLGHDQVPGTGHEAGELRYQSRL